MADGDAKLDIVAQQVALLTRDSGEVKQQVALLTRDSAEVKQQVALLTRDSAEVKQRLDKLEHGQQELKVDLAQHTNAILGEMRKLIGVLDDKIEGHIHDPEAHTA